MGGRPDYPVMDLEPENGSPKRTAGICIVKWENAHEAWG
jgi:hypothetical protein